MSKDIIYDSPEEILEQFKHIPSFKRKKDKTLYDENGSKTLECHGYWDVPLRGFILWKGETAYYLNDQDHFLKYKTDKKRITHCYHCNQTLPEEFEESDEEEDIVRIQVYKVLRIPKEYEQKLKEAKIWKDVDDLHLEVIGTFKYVFGY